LEDYLKIPAIGTAIKPAYPSIIHFAIWKDQIILKTQLASHRPNILEFLKSNVAFLE